MYSTVLGVLYWRQNPRKHICWYSTTVEYGVLYKYCTVWVKCKVNGGSVCQHPPIQSQHKVLYSSTVLSFDDGGNRSSTCNHLLPIFFCLCRCYCTSGSHSINTHEWNFFSKTLSEISNKNNTGWWSGLITLHTVPVLCSTCTVQLVLLFVQYCINAYGVLYCTVLKLATTKTHPATSNREAFHVFQIRWRTIAEFFLMLNNCSPFLPVVNLGRYFRSLECSWAISTVLLWKDGHLNKETCGFRNHLQGEY